GPIPVARRARQLGAGPSAAELPAQITNTDLRHAAVIAEDRLDLAIDPIPGPIADRGNEDAVMKNLARGRTRRPRNEPADIGLVRYARAKRDELAAIEHGSDHHDVGHVRVAGLEGIVGDEAVPIAHVGNGVALHHALDR